MPDNYDRKCGRVGVSYTREYGDTRAVAVSCPDGWNDSVKIQVMIMSVEEARDLCHLLNRAIAAAES